MDRIPNRYGNKVDRRDFSEITGETEPTPEEIEAFKAAIAEEAKEETKRNRKEAISRADAREASQKSELRTGRAKESEDAKVIKGKEETLQHEAASGAEGTEDVDGGEGFVDNEGNWHPTSLVSREDMPSEGEGEGEGQDGKVKGGPANGGPEAPVTHSFVVTGEGGPDTGFSGGKGEGSKSEGEYHVEGGPVSKDAPTGDPAVPGADAPVARFVAYYQGGEGGHSGQGDGRGEGPVVRTVTGSVQLPEGSPDGRPVGPDGKPLPEGTIIPESPEGVTFSAKTVVPGETNPHVPGEKPEVAGVSPFPWAEEGDPYVRLKLQQGGSESPEDLPITPGELPPGYTPQQPGNRVALTEGFVYESGDGKPALPVEGRTVTPRSSRPEGEYMPAEGFVEPFPVRRETSYGSRSGSPSEGQNLLEGIPEGQGQRKSVPEGSPEIEFRAEYGEKPATGPGPKPEPRGEHPEHPVFEPEVRVSAKSVEKPVAEKPVVEKPTVEDVQERPRHEIKTGESFAVEAPESTRVKPKPATGEDSATFQPGSKPEEKVDSPSYSGFSDTPGIEQRPEDQIDEIEEKSDPVRKPVRAESEKPADNTYGAQDQVHHVRLYAEKREDPIYGDAADEPVIPDAASKTFGAESGATGGDQGRKPWERDEGDYRIELPDRIRLAEEEDEKKEILPDSVRAEATFHRLHAEIIPPPAHVFIPEPPRGGTPFTQEVISLVDRVLVTADPGSYRQEVRLTLNESVLPETEIHFSEVAGTFVVTLVSENDASSDLLRREAPDLAEALRGKLGGDVEVRIVTGVGADAREETV